MKNTVCIFSMALLSLTFCGDDKESSNLDENQDREDPVVDGMPFIGPSEISVTCEEVPDAAAAKNDLKALRISWDEIATSAEGIEIFRSEPNQELGQNEEPDFTIASNENEFFDESAKRDGSWYEYKVRAVRAVLSEDGEAILQATDFSKDKRILTGIACSDQKAFDGFDPDSIDDIFVP